MLLNNRLPNLCLRRNTYLHSQKKKQKSPLNKK